MAASTVTEPANSEWVVTLPDVVAVPAIWLLAGLFLLGLIDIGRYGPGPKFLVNKNRTKPPVPMIVVAGCFALAALATPEILEAVAS